MKECIFCRIVAGLTPAEKIFEDGRTLAFMDINPRSDGHSLIIPKSHASTLFDIEEEDLLAVMRTAKRITLAIRQALKPDGLLVYQLNGRAAMQLVDHFHLHLVPRWENDGVDLTHGFQPGDPDQIRAVAQKIRAALASTNNGKDGS
jgi:histidine triad (HIT) family protein